MTVNPWEIKEYKKQIKLHKLEEQLLQIKNTEIKDSMTSAETHYYMERKKLLKKQIAQLKNEV